MYDSPAAAKVPLLQHVQYRHTHAVPTPTVVYCMYGPHTYKGLIIPLCCSITYPLSLSPHAIVVSGFYLVASLF